MLYDPKHEAVNSCPDCELPLRRTAVYVDGDTAEALVCDDCHTIVDYIWED